VNPILALENASELANSEGHVDSGCWAWSLSKDLAETDMFLEADTREVEYRSIPVAGTGEWENEG